MNENIPTVSAEEMPNYLGPGTINNLIAVIDYLVQQAGGEIEIPVAVLRTLKGTIQWTQDEEKLVVRSVSEDEVMQRTTPEDALALWLA